MDLKARVDVNFERKDGRTENRTPMSHTAKAGATKSVCTTRKKMFWSIKNSMEVLDKLKSRGFSVSCLSTYDFSTLYTTLPNYLIKKNIIKLIETTFIETVLFTLLVMIKLLSLLEMTKNVSNFGLAKRFVTL